MKMNYYLSRDLIKELKENLTEHAITKEDLELLESNLSIFSEAYNTTLRSLKKTVWLYDYKTDCIYTTPSSASYFKNQKKLENVPQDIFSYNLVHSESYEVIKNVYEQLKRHARSGQFEVRLEDIDNQQVWVQIKFETIFDKDNEPSFVVFMGDNSSQSKQLQFLNHKELDMLLVVSDDTLWTAKVNVTKNITEYFARHSDNMRNSANNQTLEELSALFLPQVNGQVDQKKLSLYFDKDFLLKTAASGVQEKKYEFQCTTDGGFIKWMEGFIRFFHTPAGLYCYYYVRDIDHRKRVEQDLEKQARYDKLTGVYNRETILDISRELVDKEHDNFCALLLFNIDNVTHLIRNDGYEAAEKVLVGLSTLVNRLFKGEKVIGRSDGFEIIVVLTGKREVEDVKDVVNRVLKECRNKYLFQDVISHVTVSCGICFVNTKNPKNFTWYYQNARVALDSAKQHGKNRFETYKGLTEQYINKNTLVNEKVISKYEDDEASPYNRLSPEFIKWQCIQFTQNDFEEAVQELLKKIRLYYGADRAFCVFNKKGTSKIDVTQIYEEISIDNAPVLTEAEMQVLFKYCLEKSKNGDTLFINSIDSIKKTNPDVYTLFKKSEINCFYDYPIYVDNEVRGYIGVDNYRHNKNHFDVLYIGATVLGQEKYITSLKKQIKHLEQYDILSGVQNRQKLSSYLKDLKVNKLSSLGIGVVRISKLKSLNNLFGRDKIDSLLEFVAKVICTQFDRSSVYRRSGNEFIIIQENIAFNAFESRLEKIQQKSVNPYQGIVAIGSAWNDNEIDVDALIYSADNYLQENVSDSLIEKGLFDSKLVGDNFNNLRNDIDAGKYYLYLQPKADFATRSVIAAEALIRYKNENGNIITPANFVHKFEKTGVIYLIDFYVLEEVCKFLERQNKLGNKKFIISLNFSRRTLLVKNLIKRMEKITDKYDIARNRIEIEITESEGDIEQKTIRALGKEIIEAGYRLSLDDFGSRFCNMDVLSNMELHALKLDKSLVKDVYANERSRKVIANFLTTCRQLQIESIAEGVETEDQFRILKNMGCDVAQGYLFNKPLPLKEFERQYL
ncbi:MAG: hypothetical protein BKP49_05715 [Treponema sp. CETP13]|nr:MAG: hypothetical protein BKP49_05715 [Treponema sp. CETP13]